MIEFETHDGVAIIRFANGRLNIMSRTFHQRLCRLMLFFLRAPDLKVAILTSQPGQSFSAGDDMREFDLPLGDEPDWAQVLMLLPRDKPVIGAVRGYCLGQGLVYLLRLTDIRYATPDAQFGFPEIAHGIGGAGVVSGLDAAVPATIARYYALTGDMMPASIAERHQLINAVVDDDEIEATALATARRIASHPLGALMAEATPLAPAVRGNPYAQVALMENLWDEMENRNTES
ncbi:enoyl-CoA hydratase/isomerase family protein [Sphingobium sp. HBC34]|uniref:Enoyl-CoA hydratase/isomerase family protein n=1 Tax=Sphingobium cyanobacteriorum TaxID=3063954 RepID=A0ABT8ZMU8_9SPHN|nr:enoyl-CoA hydratase/isomerase family protein [Sphingobium sp. HBC34]MDO7835448.1 enoyl-CoA hydratase/isomerase family protein [Sphingobium sp. HBC34]